MGKLNVALLEDSKPILKHLKENLEATGLVDVIVFATSSDEFLEKINSKKPDALFLDIDLAGDSMSGLDIAYQLKLPVLFVSGHNAENIKEIEKLKREYDLIVDHITKPYSTNDIIKATTRFVNEINATRKAQFIFLDFTDTKRNKILIDSIVCLCAEKSTGAESNNKQIFFTDRKPEILINFSFVKMEEKGFDKKKFIIIHKSFRVHADRIAHYKKDTHEIEVEVFNSAGKREKKFLPVSENYRNAVRFINK